MRWVITMTIASLVAASLTRGEIREVRPDGLGDYATIQDAIIASVDGDVVELTDGTFTGAGNRDLDYGGKDLVVRSRSDVPTSCVIDCQHQGRGAFFHGGETRDASLRGVTIANGLLRGTLAATFGAGIACESGSSPTIANCIIRDCEAQLWYSAFGEGVGGGGIGCRESASPRITGCELIDNRAGTFAGVPRPCWGGGLACLVGSAVVIENSRIARNAANLGAGLYLDGSATVAGCILEENECLTEESLPAQGGGLFCGENSAVTVVDCTIRDNRAVGRGAGLGGRGGGAAAVAFGEFRRCIVTGNVAAGGDASYGGGLYLTASARAYDSTIAGNTAGADRIGEHGYGGGVYLTSILENCVVTGNLAKSGGGVLASAADIKGCSIVSNGSPLETTEGGGVCAWGIATIERSILWWNCSADMGDNLFVYADGSVDVTCSAQEPGAGSSGGFGIIRRLGPQVTSDPLLCAPAACTEAPTDRGLYTLATSSPCLPESSPCGQLIGALGAGCESVPVEASSWGRVKDLFRPR